MKSGKKNLTLFEASSIVAGLGIGGGIMAVPYLASKTGLFSIITVLLAAYLISLLMHLVIARIVMDNREGGQLVEIFGKVLKRIPGGAFLLWLLFFFIVINFFAVLAAFLAGCGEILNNLTGLNVRAGMLAVFLAASAIVFLGLKAIGASEKYAIIGIAVLLAVLSLGSIGNTVRTIPFFFGGVKESLALYGMIMFSLTCFFSVPEAVEGLSWNKKLIPWSVVIGLSINMIFILVLSIMAVIASKTITRVAIIGWGRSLGAWANVSGSLFVFLAMLTSYWAVSYALMVVIKERLDWSEKTSWLAATLPAILVAFTGIAGFMEYLKIAGGAMSIIIAVLIILVFIDDRRKADSGELGLRMGKWAKRIYPALLLIAYLLMAAGSMINPD